MDGPLFVLMEEVQSNAGVTIFKSYTWNEKQMHLNAGKLNSWAGAQYSCKGRTVNEYFSKKHRWAVFQHAAFQ